MTLFILGLDGASLANLKVAMDRIDLPNIRKVLAIGQSFDLQSTYPCMTGPAWTSLFSGVNPGKHGIFDQVDYRGADFTPSNMRGTDTPLLWDYLTWAGKKTLVMGAPFVFPAPKIKGVFVTGNFCPKLSCYPADVAQRHDLSGFDYGELLTPQQVTEKMLMDGSASWSRVAIAGLEKRIKAASELIDSQTWDVVIVVDAMPDEIFHIGGGDKQMEDEVFRGLDRLVGAVLSRLKDGDNLLLVSDHGFSPLAGVVFINEWLRQKGYLAKNASVLTRTLTSLGVNWDLFNRPGLASRAYAWALRHFPGLLNRLTSPLRGDLLLDGDSDQGSTKAVALNSGGPVAWIRVNSGRDGGKAASLEDSLIRDLGELQRDGLLKNIFRADELFSGKHTQESPGTILVESNEGLAIDTRRMFAKSVLGKPLLTKAGDHRMQGVLVYVGSSTLRGLTSPSIYDITPTALASLRIPAPAYLDGKNLLGNADVTDPRLNVPQSL